MDPIAASIPPGTSFDDLRNLGTIIPNKNSVGWRLHFQFPILPLFDTIQGIMRDFQEHLCFSYFLESKAMTTLTLLAVS